MQNLKKKVAEALEGEIVKKFKSAPKIKPPRRRPTVKNKTNRTDYMKEYMKEYRGEGKDYQKSPEAIKELRKKQRERLQKKFDLKSCNGSLSFTTSSNVGINTDTPIIINGNFGINTDTPIIINGNVGINADTPFTITGSADVRQIVSLDNGAYLF